MTMTTFMAQAQKHFHKFCHSGINLATQSAGSSFGWKEIIASRNGTWTLFVISPASLAGDLIDDSIGRIQMVNSGNKPT
jgi:hypothetical protein